MSDLPLTNAGNISDSVVSATEPGRNLGGPGPFLSTAADARRREEWKDAFQDAEDLLDDFKSFYEDKTRSDLPESEINAAEQLLFDIPGASVFDYIDFKDGTELSYTDFIRKDISGPNGVGNPVERYVYNSQSVVGVLRSLYILIFKKDELTFQYVPKEPPHDGDAAPTFDGIFLRFSLGRFKSLINKVKAELDAREDAFEEAIPVTEEEAAEIEGDLSDEDVDFIVENQSFENMFSTTFDIETISLIPILYNFYLTSEYFQDINKAFQNPKNTALGIILSTIANDGEYNASPVLSRPASRDGLQAMQAGELPIPGSWFLALSFTEPQGIGTTFSGSFQRCAGAPAQGVRTGVVGHAGRTADTDGHLARYRPGMLADGSSDPLGDDPHAFLGSERQNQEKLPLVQRIEGVPGADHVEQVSSELPAKLLQSLPAVQVFQFVQIIHGGEHNR